jgi:vang-like
MSANDRLYEEYEYERRLKKRKARLITTTEEAFAHIKRVQPEQVNATNMDDEESEATTTATNQRRTNNNYHQQQQQQQQIRSGMDPMEAAQAVFTSIARDLRRYLRITRQQPYFTRDSIVAHLANCISYDMSPKAFLEKYVSGESLLFNERALINPFNQYKQLQMQQELMHKQQQQQQLVNRNNYATGLKTLDQTWILISDNALYQNIEDNLMIVLKQNDVTLMCNFKRLPRFKLIEDILDPKRNKFMLKLNSETTV